MADGDITLEDWLVLRVAAIGRREPSSGYDVDRIASLPADDIRRVLVRLEDEGWLRSGPGEPAATDHRLEREYVLTPAGNELADREVVGRERPWTLDCRLAGRRTRARARARAFDLVVAEAFDDAARAADALRAKDAAASRREGYTTRGHGKADDRAVNDAVERALSMVDASYRHKHPDRDAASLSGVAGFRAREAALDAAEDTRARIAALEPPSVDAMGFLTPLVELAVRAVYGRFSLRRALAEERTHDIFRRRHRAVLMVIQYGTYPAYHIPDYLDDYVYQTVGDIYGLIEALEDARALYTSPG